MLWFHANEDIPKLSENEADPVYEFQFFLKMYYGMMLLWNYTQEMISTFLCEQLI